MYRNLYVLKHGSEKTPLEAEMEQLLFPSHLHKGRGRRKKKVGKGKPKIQNYTPLNIMLVN